MNKNPEMKKQKGMILASILVMLFLAFLLTLVVIQGIQIQGSYIGLTVRRVRADYLNEAGIIRMYALASTLKKGVLNFTEYTFTEGDPQKEVKVTVTKDSSAGDYCYKIDVETAL